MFGALFFSEGFFAEITIASNAAQGVCDVTVASSTVTLEITG